MRFNIWKKEKNFLSAKTRFKGALLAAFYAFIVFIVMSILSYGFKIVPEPIAGFMIIVSCINIIFYILLNWFAAKGEKLGKIAFCLCLAIELFCLFLTYISDDVSIVSFAAYTSVPVLLNMYVLDYLNLTKKLDGYSREKYGLYSAIIVGVISLILHIILPDKEVFIDKILGILINGITVYAFSIKKFPFSKEETVAVSSTSNNHSSNTTNNYNNSSSTRKEGGVFALECELRSQAPCENVYYLSGSCEIRTKVSVSKSYSYGVQVSWEMQIYGYREGVQRVVENAYNPENAANNFKTSVEAALPRVKDQIVRITSEAIKEVRKSYSDIDDSIRIDYSTSQIN